jgi:hypothetical protein
LNIYTPDITNPVKKDYGEICMCFGDPVLSPLGLLAPRDFYLAFQSDAH